MDGIANSTFADQNSTALYAQEIARKKYMYHCQYDPIISAGNIIKQMNVVDMIFHMLLLLVTTATIAIFVELVFFLKENLRLSDRRRLTILQAGAPVVFSVTSAIGLFSPVGYVMLDFVSSVYFGIALHSFLVLMVNYYGGQQQLLLRFKRDNKKIMISTGPLCCLFRCLPLFEMNQKTFTLLWYATFQAAFFRPIILLFQSIFDADPSIIVNPMVYAAFLVASMISGVWALIILRKSSTDFLSRFRITGKYFTFQLILLICNVQPFLIKIFYISCDLPYTVVSKSVILNYQIMIFEFFVLALITRFLYRQPSDNEQLEPISKVDLSTTNSQNGDGLIAEKMPLAELDRIGNGNHTVICMDGDTRSDQVV